MNQEVFMKNFQRTRPLLLVALFFAGSGAALFGQSNALPRLAVVEVSVNNNSDKTGHGNRA
jgi:hypothetical protein